MLGRTYSAQDYMPIRFIGKRGEERAAKLAEQKRLKSTSQRRESSASLTAKVLPMPPPVAPMAAPPLARRMKRA